MYCFGFESSSLRQQTKILHFLCGIFALMCGYVGIRIKEKICLQISRRVNGSHLPFIGYGRTGAESSSLRQQTKILHFLCGIFALMCGYVGIRIKEKICLQISRRVNGSHLPFIGYGRTGAESSSLRQI